MKRITQCICALSLAQLSGLAHAQFESERERNRYNHLPEPAPWVEQAVVTPPKWQGDATRAFAMPGSSLQWSVVPSSFSIGGDQVVRYVVLAKSESGAVNAFYEGLNCAKAEYKIHARWNVALQTWNSESATEWKSIFDSSFAQHIKTLARMGFCDSNTAPNDLDALHKALR